MFSSFIRISQRPAETEPLSSKGLIAVRTQVAYATKCFHRVLDMVCETKPALSRFSNALKINALAFIVVVVATVQTSSVRDPT